MKKPYFTILLPLLLILLSNDMIGQTVKIRAYLNLVSGDSIKGYILAQRYLFDKKKAHESSYNKEFTLIDGSYKETKFNFKSINKMELIDLDGKIRIFVQKENFPRLLEVIYQNKVVWYKFHYYNWVNYSDEVVNYIFDEKGTEYNIGGFNSKKNKLIKFCKGNEKIIAFIKTNEMNDENILKVLKMYEMELKP
ncbi:MAG: hypothetical protein J0M25_11655 [Flavobacteriales bacterium]|nr:hypothetical protein [Flavobacteriales bacterium]